MKILWVCNTMLPVIAEHFGIEASNKEGWLTGLCLELLKAGQDGAGTVPAQEGAPEAGIRLAVAFPWQGKDISGEEIPVGGGSLLAYGFPEDMLHAEQNEAWQEEGQRAVFERIFREFEPDVIHCFGTEFGHALVLARCCPRPERLLVGIQGICTEIARAYMANLPEKVREGRSFRDLLKRDSLREQQEKYRIRGNREQEVLALARNITGRTEFDRQFAERIHPGVRYFSLNETLRPCFYEGAWDKNGAIPHSIFVSQGDYPIKGLHYAILAVGLLKEQYPDVRLKVAGNSLIGYHTLKEKLRISGYGQYLRKLIRSRGLEEQVEVLGRLDAEKMMQEYLRSSVFLCCSSSENSPNSLGEAMLLGVPCVVADVGGIPSLFDGEQDGRLYRGWREEEGDEGEEAALRQAGRIARAIGQVWEEPGTTESMRLKAREHGARTHHRAENLRNLLAIYGEIMDAGTCGRA